MSSNRNKRRRYFGEENNESPIENEEVLENETSDDEKSEEPIAELSAPEIYAEKEESEKEIVSDPVEEALEEAIEKISDIADDKKEEVPKHREYPSMLDKEKFLDRGKMRVKSKRLRLRKDPSKVASIVGLLEHGTIILIDNGFKNDSWCKVVDESGNEKGFVMKEFVSPYA